MYVAFQDNLSAEIQLIYLNDLINKYQTTIKSRQSDVQRITTLVDSEQISWIGLEFSPEEIETTYGDNYSEIVPFYLETRSQINNQVLWHPNRTDSSALPSF